MPIFKGSHRCRELNLRELHNPRNIRSWQENTTVQEKGEKKNPRDNLNVDPKHPNVGFAAV